jgi:hypothetical protein
MSLVNSKQREKISEANTILQSRLLMVVIILVVFQSFFGYGSEAWADRSGFEIKKPGPLSQALDGLEDNRLAKSSFSSNLPLIILSANFETTEVQARLTVIDGSGPVNRLEDQPTAELTVIMVNLDKKPVLDGKVRFEVRPISNENTAILGLAPGDHWLLEGSETDPAMLRNYLAYTLGWDIMDGQAPKTRFCEVFIKTKEGLLYQGIYLFSESPAWTSKDGQKSMAAVYIPDAKPWTAELTGFQLRSINRQTGQESLIKIKEAILETITSLRSEDPETYYDYLSSLDVSSSINTHILNEIMMNYQEQPLPLNIFMTPELKLELNPLWNFDQALDNTPDPLPNKALDSSQMTLWLPYLFKSVDFIKEYRSRYYKLFRSALDIQQINDLVDETVIFVGPAMVRDWERWREKYLNDRQLKPITAKNGEVLIRATNSPEQEIIKIKHLLREKNEKIRQNLLEIRWSQNLLDSSSRIWSNTAWLGLFIISFFVFVIMARKRLLG